jgi:hypothetical protein
MTSRARNFADCFNSTLGVFAIFFSLSLIGAPDAARSETLSTDVCILLIAGSADRSFVANSGAHITAPDCEIHVRSTKPPSAIINADTGFDVRRICVKGRRVIMNGNADAPVETRCDAIDDPYAGRLAEPKTDCTIFNFKAKDNARAIKLLPGVYCGWTKFNGSPRIRLKPGVYVIRDGGWIVNADAKFVGKGVTIFFADTSKIQFNHDVAIRLKPPSSGKYKGIVMYERDGLRRSKLVFNRTRSADIEGLMYLPSRDVIFNSPHVMQPQARTMVFRTMIMNRTNWSMTAAKPKVKAAAGN